MIDTQYYTFKVVIVGPTSVGKSSLIKRYSDGIFDEKTESTIGVDLRLRTMEIQGQNVKLFFWDTAGQQRFRSIVKSYYKSAKGILLVIDLTDQNWKQGLTQWLAQVTQYGDSNAIKLLIGNKVDLVEKRKVSDTEIRKFADQNQLQYYQASAKKGTNLDKVFTTIAQRLMSSYIIKQKNQNKSKKIILQEVEVKPTKWCC